MQSDTIQGLGQTNLHEDLDAVSGCGADPGGSDTGAIKRCANLGVLTQLQQVNTLVEGLLEERQSFVVDVPDSQEFFQDVFQELPQLLILAPIHPQLCQCP